MSQPIPADSTPSSQPADQPRAAGAQASFCFPRYANLLLPAIVLTILGGAGYVAALVTYGASPQTLQVGYSPQQPIPYSHALHAGQLKIDCRYCHTTVETTAFAALPPTQTCLNCHNDKTQLRWDSAKLGALRHATETGEPIPWVKVHDLPDYVFFDHSAHVQKGVSCISCHGRIDQMDQVRQARPMTMSNCLECHNNAATAIRPLARVTDLGWKPSQATLDERREVQGLRKTLPTQRQMTDCSTCHR